MITDLDIKNLITAMKEEFPDKQDFDDLKSDFRTLQTSVDNFAKV